MIFHFKGEHMEIFLGCLLALLIGILGGIASAKIKNGKDFFPLKNRKDYFPF